MPCHRLVRAGVQAITTQDSILPDDRRLPWVFQQMTCRFSVVPLVRPCATPSFFLLLVARSGTMANCVTEPVDTDLDRYSRSKSRRADGAISPSPPGVTHFRDSSS